MNMRGKKSIGRLVRVRDSSHDLHGRIGEVRWVRENGMPEDSTIEVAVAGEVHGFLPIQLEEYKLDLTEPVLIGIGANGRVAHWRRDGAPWAKLSPELFPFASARTEESAKAAIVLLASLDLDGKAYRLPAIKGDIENAIKWGQRLQAFLDGDIKVEELAAFCPPETGRGE